MNIIIFVGRKDKDDVLEHKVMKLSFGKLLRERNHETFLRPIEPPT